MIEFNKENLTATPYKSGVYFLFNKEKKLLYVGKSLVLQRRLLQHINGYESRTKNLILEVNFFSYELASKEEISELEAKYINELKPLVNQKQEKRENVKRASFDIEVNLLTQLKVRAIQEKMSYSELVEKAIRNFLNK